MELHSLVEPFLAVEKLQNLSTTYFPTYDHGCYCLRRVIAFKTPRQDAHGAPLEAVPYVGGNQDLRSTSAFDMH